MYEFFRVLLSVLVVYAVLALVVMHLDRFLFLEQSTRKLLTFVVHGFIFFYAIGLIAVFAFRRMSSRRLAYELESRLPPDMAERYVTLAELAESTEAENVSDVSRALLNQLQREATEYSGQFRAKNLVLDRRFRILGVSTIGVLAVFVLLMMPGSYQFPLMLHRFVNPWANLAKPSFVQIKVTPAEPVIGKGGELVLQAETSGEMPAAIEWLYELLDAAPDRCMLTLDEQVGEAMVIDHDSATTTEMSRIQRTLFVFSRTDLQNSFQFRVRCADGQTAVHLADVVAQPRITGLDISITPPEYTGLPERTFDTAEAPIQLYPRSRVAIDFTVDQPVPERQLLLNDKKEVEPEWDSSSHSGHYEFEFQDDLDIEVEVTNSRGFQNLDPVRIALRAIQDQDPVVTLSQPATNIASVPGELIPMEFHIEDDLGVDEATVHYQLNVGTPSEGDAGKDTIDFEEDIIKNKVLSTMLDLGNTDAAPGDQLQVFVRGRDKSGNYGESRILVITIESFARGTNERRRLEILDFINDVLVRAVESPVPGNPMLIDNEAYTQALDRAESMSLFMAKTASLESLLARLEQEHHFTDEPRHKEDLRMLAGIMRHAGTSDMERRNAALTDIAEQMLPSLTTYRQLKNLSWRYFGLGYELEVIRETITSLRTQRQAALQVRTGMLAGHLSDVLAELLIDEEYLKLQEQIAEIQDKVREIQRQIREEKQTGFQPGSTMGGMPTQFPGPGMDESEKVLELRGQLNDLAADREKIENAVAERLTAAAQQVADAQPERTEQLIDEYGIETLTRLLNNALDKTQTPEEKPRTIATAVAKYFVERSGNEEDPLMTALNRRTSLYLSTVEAIGDALTTLTDSQAGLSRDQFLGHQGDLVAAVHTVARKEGSLATRIAACDTVNRRLQEMQAAIAPEFPKYAEIEHNERKELRELFEVVRIEVATGQGEDWQKQAESWFLADMRMMGFNPYAELWPYIEDLALLRQNVRSPANTRLNTAMERPAAADRIRLRNQTLAFSRELNKVLSLNRISDAEKALASLLIGLEAAHTLGPRIVQHSAEHYAEQLRTFDPATPVTELPQDFADLCPTQVDTLASVDDGLKSNTHVQRQLLSFDIQEALVDMARSMQTTASMFDAASRTLATSEDPGATVLKLLERAESELGRIKELTMLLRLKLTYAPDTVPEDYDVLFLILRQAINRYESRNALLIGNLRSSASGSMSAAEIQTTSMGVGRLGRSFAGLQNNIREYARKLAEGTLVQEDTRQEYPLLKDFQRTKKFIAYSREALQGGDRTATAENFLLEFPNTAVSYLVSQRDLLEVAETSLKQCSAELNRESRSHETYASALSSARENLVSFQDALAIAGQGGVQSQLNTTLQALNARVRNLDFNLKTATDADVRARMFALGEIMQTLERMLRILDNAAFQQAGMETAFDGGPANIRAEDNFRSAEDARRRIESLADHANRQVIFGILGGLRPDADVQDRKLGAAWSHLLYQMVRSPLTGSVREERIVTLPPPPEDDLVKWLTEQLEEARKETRRKDNMKYYRNDTIEWVDAMKDFIRY